MRTKAVPPAPKSLSGLEEAKLATPLVPEPHESCCVRLASRLEQVNKDEARYWLAFMQALGLVEEGALGYVRTTRDIDPTKLQEPFLSSVFGARELIDQLEASGPVTADEAFESFREHVPQWERHRNPNTWEALWRERIEDLLGWSCLFGLATQRGEQYELV